MMADEWIVGGKTLNSRLFLGTGKFADHHVMKHTILASNVEVVTVALRRVNLKGEDPYILNDIPEYIQLMPNTSGARNAEEAIRIARLARASGLGNWIKIEVIPDQKYLLPDNHETIKATAELAKEGFQVFPYMNPDLLAGKALQEVGAAAVMPLGAPIGSNRGIRLKEMIRIMIDELEVPIIVDAGIGKPSDAAIAMEMGADAVLVNTAIATATNPVQMAQAFSDAVSAGRRGFLAGPGPASSQANPSSPLTGFLHLSE